MTRAKAAPAADDLRTLKAGAIARVQARRRPAKYAEVPDLRTGGTVKWQIDPGGTFTDPATLDEWCDDRLARTPLADGASNVLIRMWEMMRTETAERIVAFAENQVRDPHGLWCVWMVLRTVPSGPKVLADVKSKWETRGLPTQPVPPVRLEPIDRNAASERARRVTYKTKWGNPAA